MKYPPTIQTCTPQVKQSLTGSILAVANPQQPMAPRRLSVLTLTGLLGKRGARVSLKNESGQDFKGIPETRSVDALK